MASSDRPGRWQAVQGSASIDEQGERGEGDRRVLQRIVPTGSSIVNRDADARTKMIPKATVGRSGTR